MINLMRIGLMAIVIQLTGCAVIHFENGVPAPDPDASNFSLTFGLFSDEPEEIEYDPSATRYRKWYHLGILQIAEISNPLETSLVCSGLEWNQVTTEVTPFDAVAGLLDNVLLLPASSAGLDLWSPWSIEYSCRDER